MATHLIEVLKRQSVRLSAQGVRVLVTAAVLFGVTGFGMENARAQGQLGWPQWMPVDGWKAPPFSLTAMYFFDPIHAVAATSVNGSSQIRYILHVGTPWRTATMPSGIDSIRAIRLIQGKLYAAAHGSDVLVSSDSGKTWNYSGLGLTDANDVYADGTGKIRALFDPMKTFARLDTLHCIATGSGSIFVSSDGGITWNTSVTGIDPNSAGAFADRCTHAFVCPFAPGTGVRSLDSGRTWQSFSIGMISGDAPESAYGASNVVYFTFPEHMY